MGWKFVGCHDGLDVQPFSLLRGGLINQNRSPSQLGSAYLNRMRNRGGLAAGLNPIVDDHYPVRGNQHS
jgi:hypothetical protein